MKAPHYMRADLICEVAMATVAHTSDVIQRIDIRRNAADVVTAEEMLTFSVDLGHSLDDNGSPILGSDYWTVALVGRRRRTYGWLSRLFRVVRRD